MKNFKRIISLMMALTLILGSIPLTTFTAFAAETPKSTGVVYGSGGTITRAEWLHDLSIVFDMTVESDAVPDNYFNDLEDSHPYYNDILLTVEFGVVNVEAGGNIYPDALVNRDFAVTTLNFCLGYQASEDDVFTFSDADDCSSPTDALIAIERGWLELVEGKFMPEQAITSAESETMLNDAVSVLKVSEIDANYDSTYDFKDDVIVVPEGTLVTADEDTVIIEDSPVTISAGDRFAVYENGIPTVYVADSVEIDETLTIITVTADSGEEDAFAEIDAQGQVASGNMEFIPAEGVEIEFEEAETEPALRKAPGLKAVRSQAKIKKNIKAKTQLTLMPGVTANLNVKINNPVVNYQISGSYSYVTLEGDAEISYGLKGDLADALGKKSIELFTCSVGGIGNFDITVELGFSGSVSGKVTGYLVAGIECAKGDRIRAVYNFQQKEYYVTAEAEASVGIKAWLGVTKLPIVKAYIYAEIGAKANLKVSSYKTAPYRCTHFAAYLYLKYGAEASVKFGGWKTSVTYNVDVFHDKNSPLRIVHHYEDGVEVPSCTRGTSYDNFFTKYNSRYGGSGWSGANGAYGLDAAGNTIPLYDYSLNDNNKATITKYNGNSYYVSIPKEIDGYTVIAIGNAAFKGKTIRMIDIPDTVVTIGESAFRECRLLLEIIIPENVTTINKDAFYACTKLHSVELPQSLTRIEDTVFMGCSDLNSITLPSSLVYLGSQSFSDCDSLTTINIPKSLTSVGTGLLSNSGPFLRANALENIEFEEGITKVINNLFAGCNGLKTVIIPNSISIIGSDAFRECNSLETVNIGDSVVEIGRNAFLRCPSLNAVSFSENMTRIDESAFSGCKNLLLTTLPENLTYLGSDAFSYCYSISEITIPKSLTSVDTGLLGNNGPFYGCNGLKKATIEHGTKTIPNNLFVNCSGLESIQIPDTVTKISRKAFYDCSSLNNIDIPKSVTDIGAFAFAGCTQLSTIQLPDSVLNIGDYVFSNCKSLSNVSFPHSIQTIVPYMFSNCSSIKDIKIPSSVRIIQNGAFYGCADLDCIAFEDGTTALEEIQNSAFSGCTALKEVILPETVKTVASNAFQNCTSLEKVYIPQSTKTLGSYAFQGNESLNEVIISDYSITKIDDYTFKDCPALASIVLPKGLTTVGSQAFMNDTTLFDVTVPESVTSINSNALSYPAKTTIHGKVGSYAETFATNGGFNFNDIGIAAEGIALVDGVENITLDVGETYRAEFEVFPENANDVITITSNNTKVSINGHDIKASSAGDSVLTATASSGVTYEFNVHIRSVSKIAVKTPADKLTYIMGEEFDRTGLVAEVTYNDKSTKEVTDFTISGFDSSVEGTCTVTLSWVAANGSTYRTTLNVEIIDPTPKLTDIVIQTLPTKLEYERKEALDLTGMVVMGNYTDGSSKEITDYTVSGYNALKYGTQTITVTYQEKTATFTVTVKCASHAFEDWTTVEDPTCTEPGKKVHTCANCGYVEEEGIPATGHDYHSVVTKPTCTENGYTTHTCTRCGDSYTDTEVEAKGHTLGDTWESNDTAHWHKCSVCGEAEEYADHVYDNDWDASCNVCGYVREVRPIDENDPQVVIDSKKVLAGKEIAVAVDFHNNPGIAYLKLELDYDDTALELISATNSQLLTGTYTTSRTLETKPYVLQWMGADDSTESGELAILTFKVKDDAEAGDYTISLNVVEAYNADYEDVTIAAQSGMITVQTVLIGDFNGDGKINGKDGILCSQALAGWDVEYSELAADVNGDGKFNGKDGILLSQYLAGWDVVLG